MSNVRKSLETARASGIEVRGIAVINPGNPTGNILAEDQIRDIIQVSVGYLPDLIVFTFVALRNNAVKS